MGGVGLSYIRSLTAVPASIWMGKSNNRAGVDAHDVTFGTAALVVALVMAAATALLMQLWGEASGCRAGCFVGDLVAAQLYAHGILRAPPTDDCLHQRLRIHGRGSSR